MTKSQNTKRALLASVLSMMLCIAMLVGSTFAWFTDTVTSGKNKIVAGNLDVELNWSTDGSTWERVNEDTDMFKDTLWEPGYTRVVYLQVENVGSLALKYQFGINVADKVIGKTADDKDIDLSEFIKFGVVENAAAYTADDAGRTAAREAVKDSAVLVSAGYASDEGHLSANTTSDTIALVVYMPEETGNDANHGFEKTAPSVDLGITLVATQYTEEPDSFGTDYDANATYPVITDTSWYDAKENSFELTNAGELAGLSKLVNGGESFEGKTITLTENVDLSGIENWIPIGSADTEFMGTFDGGNKTVSNLTINDYTPIEDQAFVGLFGMALSAEVKNVTVTGNINITNNTTNGLFVGGVCGLPGYTNFTNCTNEVTISVTSDDNASAEGVFVGGIFGGTAINNGGGGNRFVVSKCTNNASLNANIGYVGGIAGLARTDHVDAITCANNGAINGSESSNLIGLPS